VGLLGAWPTFHDSEVLSVGMERNEGTRLSSPVVTISVLILRAQLPTNNFVQHDCIAVFQFRGVESFFLEGFNHQNALLDFRFETQFCERLKREVFEIEFLKGLGMSSKFSCDAIELLSIKKAQLSGNTP
jgi:hypothetical protein